MKAVTLSASEVSLIRFMGWIIFENKSEHYPLEMDVGETVAILEPWAQLKAPPGAYNTDLPPRYIYQADRTAEPYRFQYQPPETMPLEAVKRRATVAWVEGGMMRLDLIGSQPECKSTII